MSSILPYSYSSLTSYENCPRKHYEERIVKSTPIKEYAAAVEGTAAHKLAEDYINEGKPFEHKYKVHIMEVVDELKSKEGEVFSEKQLCITKKLEPCEWRAPEAYSRGVLDVLHVGDKEATIVDWKTGKADVFSTQLKLNAIMVMCAYPKIEKVNTRYEWLKEGFNTKAVVHRDFIQADWGKFENRVSKFVKSFETNNWPAKKSGLCKNYCEVATCEHNGKYNKD